MNINIEFVYIFIILFVCIVILCIALIYLYTSIQSKYTALKTAGLSEKDHSIVNNAEKIAAKIINSAKKLDEKFDQAVSTSINQIILKWNDDSNALLSKNLKVLDDELKKTIQDIYNKENDELALYKKTKLKDFDLELSQVVKKLSKEIIMREIDTSQHKKLIEEGLERAKKDGLFKWCQNAWR